MATARIAGLQAGAAYGRLGMTQEWGTAEGDLDDGVRVHAVMRLALASGRRTVLDDARARVLARMHGLALVARLSFLSRTAAAAVF